MCPRLHVAGPIFQNQMPTPRAGYLLKDGTKAPSVTTILSRFKESGPLMHWAFQQGKSGAERLYDAAEKAADIGSCAHHMVELHIHGHSDAVIDNYCRATMLDLSMAEKAKSSFLAYRAWERNFKIKILQTEIYMVSEKHRYGGTPDAIGTIDGQLVLPDWKTSNGVYADYLIQLAAYGKLWEENHPDQPITGGFHLLRFAKEHGDFSHHYYPKLDNAWRQFLLFREAFEIDKELKARSK